jgi:hypothetical protein
MQAGEQCGAVLVVLLQTAAGMESTCIEKKKKGYCTGLEPQQPAGAAYDNGCIMAQCM